MTHDVELSSLWDRLLLATASHERSRLASLELQASVLSAVEMTLDPLGHNSVADRLTRLWNRFDELSTHPNNRAVRELVLGDAEALAAAVRRDATMIDAARTRELDHLRRRVSRLNELLIEWSGETESPDVGLELSSLVSVEASERPRRREQLCFDHPSVIDRGPFELIDLQTKPFRQVAIIDHAGGRLHPTGGSIHGSIVLLSRFLPALATWLQRLTSSMAVSMNRLHQLGTGLDGTTDLSLFDPAGLTPNTFAVNPPLVGHPERLAAGGPVDTTASPLDNGIAMAIARLGTDPAGPWAPLRQGIHELGVMVADLNAQANAARHAFHRAERSRQESSVSSLNRKLAGLLSAQEALEAAARVDATISGVLDTVESSTGLEARANNLSFREDR